MGVHLHYQLHKFKLCFFTWEYAMQYILPQFTHLDSQGMHKADDETFPLTLTLWTW